LNLLLEKNIPIAVSDYILEETRRNLSKKLKEKRKERAIELFNSITSFFEIKKKEDYTVNMGKAKKMINYKDAPILACAMLRDVELFITRDKDFLGNKEIKKLIRIANSKEAIKLLKEKEN
jgi:predicted nucleic acid-binding protein